jgi:hypothetical protein
MLITKGIPQKGVQTLCVREPEFGTIYTNSDNDVRIKTFTASPTPLVHESVQFIRSATLWLVFLFITLKIIKVDTIPFEKLIFAMPITTLILSGTLLVMHLTGMMPLAWEQVELESKRFRHRENHQFTYNLGSDRYSDTKLWDYPAYLYEDDVLLLQAHESQSLIAEYGRGRYILREDLLFFSTSDNSDPRDNERRYTLKTPAHLRTRYQIAAIVAAAIGMLVHLVYILPFSKTTRNHERKHQALL